MKLSIVSLIIRLASGAASGLLLVTAVLQILDDNRNLGVTLSLLLGVLTAFAALCPPSWAHAVPFWIRLGGGILLLILLTFATGLFAVGRADTVTHTEDAVIVLGCRVHGTEPSDSLARRLDCALELYRKNPDVLLVVSGGKGDDEHCSEAEAMSTYLQKHGVPASSILPEDRSTSTAENFRFCKQLLDERFDTPYTVAFVTNDYHIYRASLLAEAEGYEGMTHAFAPTPFCAVFASGLRETGAVIAAWLAG